MFDDSVVVTWAVRDMSFRPKPVTLTGGWGQHPQHHYVVQRGLPMMSERIQEDASVSPYHETSNSTQVVYLTSSLPHLPLDQRKTLLDYVRLQTPFDSLSDYYLGDFKKALLHNVPLFYDEEEQGYCHLHELSRPTYNPPYSHRSIVCL